MSQTAEARTHATVGVADGRLVLHPSPDGGTVVLVAGEGIHFTKAGRDGGQRLEVASISDIGVDVGDCEAQTTMDVQVAEDLLTARLTVVRAAGLRHVLRDVEPAAEITLTRSVVECVEAPPATVDQARQALQAAGVTVGIDEAALAACVAAADGTPQVVARGTAPTPGTDAVVTDTFSEHRARNALYTVSRGSALAAKVPAVPGIDGVAVTGVAIAAPTPADAPLAGGTGTSRTTAEDGTVRLYAAVDGRPVHAGAMVVVEQSFTLGGDVDVATGDLDVNASLIVTGDVVEGRTIRVKHDLTIHGRVERADIEAGGSLTIGGACMHTRLRAGGQQAVLAQLLAAVDPIVGDLDTMATTLERLVSGAAQRGRGVTPGQALLVLLEGPFAHVRAPLAQAMRLVSDQRADTFDEATVSALTRMHLAVDRLGMHELRDVADLRHRISGLAVQVESLRRQVAEPSAISVAYLQACQVEASGDLVITGHGIFNSEIFIGGDLRCEGGTSTLRGGRTKVGGTVRVHELGGDGGARMDVDLEGVTATCDRLHANVVHPGVHVTVNACEVAFDEPRRDVNVGVDDAGRIVPAAP